ncbi:hypothetical protein [Gluconobacter oxydans]|uniref:hypothetical protein n=1 Tax=Gluconobacter oxydans TaxID=442 RepID=UPI0039E8FDFE
MMDLDHEQGCVRADRAIVFADGNIVADETNPNPDRMNDLLMQERRRSLAQQTVTSQVNSALIR